jgi:Phage integrase, N-terminal SAM-like domain
MSALPVPAPGAEVIDISSNPEFARALELAQDYARAQTADATIRAYRSDAQHFAGWCKKLGFTPIPAAPEVVAAYLAALADAGPSVSTISRGLAAITYVHRLAGMPSPAGRAEPVKATLRGIGRGQACDP